jgi:hypothetical protein
MIFLALLLCAASALASQPKMASLKVSTWNASSLDQAEAALAEIKDQAPDVVLLQQCAKGEDAVKELLERLHDLGFQWKTRPPAALKAENYILARRDMNPVMMQDPVYHGVSCSIGGRLGLECEYTYALAKLDNDGAGAVLVSTYVDAHGGAQLQDTLKTVTSPRRSLIIGGELGNETEPQVRGQGSHLQATNVKHVKVLSSKEAIAKGLPLTAEFHF